MRIRGIPLKLQLDQVKKSKKYCSNSFFCCFIKSDLSFFTISIGKKSGKAHIRNKIRRWFKCYIQQKMNEKLLLVNCFIFVYPKNFTFQEIKKEIDLLWNYLSQKV